MTRGWIAALGLLLLIAAGVWFTNRAPAPSLDVAPESAAPVPVPSEGSPITEATPSSAPASAPKMVLIGKKRIDPKKFNLVKDAPTPDEVREQVRAEPHGTPEGYKMMAMVMAGKMEPALASEADARALMPELRDCSRESPFMTMKQLCLVNARRLANKYPGLAPDFERMSDEAGPEAREGLQNLAPRKD